MIDLSRLPDVQFCEVDAAPLQETVMAAHEAITGRTLYPGNPERLLLESLVYTIALQRFVIDYTGKQNLLRYAEGANLDALAALLGVERLAPARAATTLRFSLDAALPFAVPVPAGTRATPDGELLFVTVAAAEVPAGATAVEVVAQAQTAGAAGNGYVPGQIRQLVDPTPYVAGVTNLTTSLGGADTETDARLRERTQLAPEAFATAGPGLAYEYWVRATHQDVSDVSVTSPAPGQVDVRILVAGGELPTQELVDAVQAQLNEDRRRPLTDQVSVAAPEIVATDVSVTWYVARPDAALAAQIQSSVTAAVDSWVAWQRRRIGRDINPSELIHRIQGAGAKRVEVYVPAFQALTATQVWQPGQVLVAYGGVEDE